MLFRSVGLAGALSISYFVGAWITIRLLKRYEIAIKLPEVIGFYLKLVLLAAIVIVPMFLLQGHIPGGNTLRLIMVLGICGVGYLLLAKFAKVEEVHNLIVEVARRSK